MAFVSLQYEEFYLHVQIHKCTFMFGASITILGLWNQIKSMGYGKML